MEVNSRIVLMIKIFAPLLAAFLLLFIPLTPDFFLLFIFLWIPYVIIVTFSHYDTGRGGKETGSDGSDGPVVQEKSRWKYLKGGIPFLIYFIAIRMEYGPISGPLMVLAGLYYGFKTFSRWQLISSIPTSKIRSLAMGGLVEVIGRGTDAELYKAPDGRDCTFYKYCLEQYVGGKGSDWKTIGEGISDRYFHIEDDTGKIMVDTENADFRLKQDTREYLDDGEVPDHVREILNEHGLAEWGKKEEFLIFEYNKGSRLRLTQYSIEPGEEVYVIGKATVMQKEDGEELPVMMKDREHDIFIISDKEEETVSKGLQGLTAIHLAAAFAGVVWFALSIV